MATAALATITGVKDWEGGLDHAVADLAAAETAVLGGQSGRRYRRSGRVLIASDLLGRRLPAWPIGGQLKSALAQSGHSPLRAQLTSLASPEYALPCRADVVLLKANLRGFYLEQGITIKVPNPGRVTARERFRAEVKLRRALRGTANVFLPRLVNPPNGGGEAFVAEDIVAGDELSSKVTDDLLADWLLEFYVHNGMRAEALESFLEFDAARDTVVGYCKGVRLQPPKLVERWLNGLSNGVSASRQTVFGATCNGDLTQTNLISSDGRICIIDWEYVGRSLVCGDVVRLATQRAGFLQAWLRVLEQAVAGQSEGVMPARDQMLAGALKVLVERIDRTNDFSNPDGNAEYRKRLSKRVGQIMQLCERLLLLK